MPPQAHPPAEKMARRRAGIRNAGLPDGCIWIYAAAGARRCGTFTGFWLDFTCTRPQQSKRNAVGEPTTDGSANERSDTHQGRAPSSHATTPVAGGRRLGVDHLDGPFQLREPE